MKAFILLLIPTALLGCPLEEDDSYKPLPVYVTPKGYRFEFKDLGSERTGILDVAIEFDKAVALAADKLWLEHQIPLTETHYVMLEYWVRVIDGFMFYTPSSPTGYATGAIEPQNRKMYLALYRRQRHDGGPVWTHFTWPSTGETHSGAPYAPWFPALSHELEHHFNLIPGTHRSVNGWYICSECVVME